MIPLSASLRRLSPALAGTALLAASGLGGEAPAPGGWPCFGGNVHHTASSTVASRVPGRIRWSTPVDLDPQYTGDSLFIHYGSPLATAANTIIFPVKTGAEGGFRVEARAGATGASVWTLDTDWDMPGHDWPLALGPCIAPSGKVVVPALGGTLLLRSDPDSVTGAVERVAFFGTEAYEDDPESYDDTVRINTPVTADAQGNLYFGFVAEDGAPDRLRSGIAKVAPDGTGRWISARAAARAKQMKKVVHNCAPALSLDGRILYVAVTDEEGSGYGAGYLLGLDSRTLSPRYRRRLRDPYVRADSATLPDDGTASPTVAPDGEVYFGVLSFYNRFHGWMLHFNRNLSKERTPGGFGWDDTASIVPRAAVPSYGGDSDYLLLTKFNDYVQAGGTGVHRMTVLDPWDTMEEAITGIPVMKEILSVTGPTPDEDLRDEQHPDAVREWCINTAAVDVPGQCAIVGNEDGILYRWSFATNTLSASVVLTEGVGEAYTPTIIGPDGAIYAINDGALYCVEDLP